MVSRGITYGAFQTRRGSRLWPRGNFRGWRECLLHKNRLSRPDKSMEAKSIASGTFRSASGQAVGGHSASPVRYSMTRGAMLRGVGAAMLYLDEVTALTG